MSELDEPQNPETELSDLRARNAMLETALREAREAADRRIVESELRAEAIRHGMIDLDGLRLLEAVDMKPDENGTVKGASAAISRLQRNKPWLFTAPNSSSLAAVPPSTPVRAKLATEMTLQEWKLARSELLRRR